MINVEALEKKFGKKKVLRNINVQVKAGEIAALAGPNGAGKTTLLNIIAGLSKSTGGKIQLGRMDSKKYVNLNRGIGYFQQDFSFFNHRTAADQLNLLFDLSGYTKEERKKFLDTWIRDLQLGEHYKEKIKNLSHGTVVKLNFLQTIIADPPIMIFDEPFSGLDVEQVALIRKYLLKLKSNTRAILISSHDLHLLDGLCNKFIFIREGEIIQSLLQSDLAQNFLTIYGSKDDAHANLPKLLASGYKAKALDDEKTRLIVQCETKDNREAIKKMAASLKTAESTIQDVYQFYLF